MPCDTYHQQYCGTGICHKYRNPAYGRLGHEARPCDEGYMDMKLKKYPGRMGIRKCKRIGVDLPTEPVPTVTGSVGLSKIPKYLIGNLDSKGYHEVSLRCATGTIDKVHCPNSMCGSDDFKAIKYLESYCATIDDTPGANGHEKILGANMHCAKWRIKRPVEYKELLKKTCNNLHNMGSNKCKEFCLANPGECPYARDYCAFNPDDKICSCINSPLNPPNNEGLPPVTCFDNTCSMSGYKESAYGPGLTTPCPSYINCKQIVDMRDGAVLDNINIQQSCSSEIKIQKELDRRMLEDARVEDARVENSLVENSLVEDVVKQVDKQNSEINSDAIEPMVVFFIIILAIVTGITLYFINTNSQYSGTGYDTYNYTYT